MADNANPLLEAPPDVLPPDLPILPLVGKPDTKASERSDCGPPQTDFPKEHFAAYFRDVKCALIDLHVPEFWAQLVAAFIVVPFTPLLYAKDLVIAVLAVFMPPFAGFALSIIDSLRKTLDPEFAALSVTVLSELMGADLSIENLPRGTDYADHLARADALGNIFHNLLAKEFAESNVLTPAGAVKSAERFSGLVINFGTATGIIAAIGALVPFCNLAEVREIAEEVASNLGLGRLHRMVMRPLIETMIATPYQWALNLKYRPAQLTPAQLANPYTGTVIDPSIVHDSLARLGYSDDKIKALVELHQKKISFSDVYDFRRRGLMPADEYAKRTKALSIPEQDVLLWESIEDRKLIDKWEGELLSAAAEGYRFGNIARDELANIAKSILLRDSLVDLFLTMQDYKRKVPHESLTVAQLTKMFDLGILDLTELEDHLKARGFSDADTADLELLILVELGQKEEAAKKKAAAAAAKAAAAAAKSAAGSAPPPPTP